MPVLAPLGHRQVLAFDLDDTLAITKSPISTSMAALLGQVLTLFEVCVISGGAFHQFETQLIEPLHLDRCQRSRLHLMPTSGTRYYRYDEAVTGWARQYAQDLSEAEKTKVIAVLQCAATELGLWEANPVGPIVEDRGSQITFSALGQLAPPAAKYLWDPDGTKKAALQRLAASMLPDLEVRAGGTTSIDVTRRGIDKGYGMRQLMALMAIKPADIVYFGDQLEPGGNDYAVKAMGIDTIAVRDSLDTEVALNAILAVSR
jgi:HAD superfamily hydrolase (TIGR01484 family)